MTILGVTITMVAFWIILAIVFAIVEGITLSLITIWFTAGAMVAAVVAIFDVNVVTQIIIFVIVSLALMIVSRPVLKKHLKKGTSETNVDSVINKEGIVEETIEPLKVGAVRVNGLVWSAITKDNISIEKGQVVVIKAVEGIKVIVEKEERR